MNDLLSLLLLAFAVSLDSFSVGLTYGMRRVSIPKKSIMIISSCTFFVLLIAMGMGHSIERYFSYQAGERIGGGILIIIGVWVLYQFFTSDRNGVNDNKRKDRRKLVEFEIKSLGLIIRILRKPMEADIDNSGKINSIEALFLGLALSLDSFGAGIGGALIDLPPILFSLVVTISSAIFVISGVKVGKVFGGFSWFNHLSFLPGVALILIGLLKIY